MKNDSRKKSKNINDRSHSRPEIIWQTIQANKSMNMSLMSSYTKDPFEQQVILSKVFDSLVALSNEKFDQIENLCAYISRAIQNECIAFSKKKAKLNEGNFEDLLEQAERALLSENLYEVQRSEMTDTFISYHRQIKAMLSEEDFDLLHRWGILKHSYAQMMTDLGLTEPQVRMRIAHLRNMIKLKFKKFWR